MPQCRGCSSNVGRDKGTQYLRDKQQDDVPLMPMLENHCITLPITALITWYAPVDFRSENAYIITPHHASIFFAGKSYFPQGAAGERIDFT